MSANRSYSLLPADRLMSHARQKVLLAHDYDGNNDVPLDIKALVASGDCFVTLATILDDTTQLLSTENATILPQLEKTITTLLYLQRHYKIVSKRSEYRQ